MVVLTHPPAGLDLSSLLLPPITSHHEVPQDQPCPGPQSSLRGTDHRPTLRGTPVHYSKPQAPVKLGAP